MTDRRSRPPSLAPSTASLRRPPPALRVPGSRPRVQSPHVSLVFAVGDALPPSAPASLRRHAIGASPSEEALSRQLDRDTAGERMGLRSRRSSAATLASMRGDPSGVGASPVLPEEDEPAVSAPPQLQPGDPQPEAGPSRPRRPRFDRHLTPDTRPTSSTPSPPPERAEMSTPQPRKVDPKSSGAWLRWNSPAPSFPRRDKGKARDCDGHADSSNPLAQRRPPDEEDGVNRGAPTLGPASAQSLPAHEPGESGEPNVPHRSDTSPTEDKIVSEMLPAVRAQSTGHEPPTSIPNASSSSPPLPHDTTSESQMDAAPSTSTLAPPGPGVPPATPSRGWRSYLWGDSTPSRPASISDARPAAPAVAATDQATEPPPAASMANGKDHRSLETAKSHASVTSNGSAVTNGSARDNTKRRKAEEDATAVAAVIPSAATTTPHAPPASTRKESAPSKRPASKSGRTQAPVATDSSTTKASRSDQGPSVTTDDATATDKAVDTEVDTATSNDGPVTPNDAPATSRDIAEDNAPPAGWGSYFYSFVYSNAPPPGPPPHVHSPPAPSETALVVEPTDPAADQKPASSPSQEESVVQPPSPPPQATEPPVEQVQQDQKQLPEQQPEHAALSAISHAPGLTPVSSRTSQHATSSSSTAGWLSYLAFRASQKKITASTRSLAEGRKSGETGREEVMDFEHDPNFPAPETQASAKDEGHATPKDSPALNAEPKKDATTAVGAKKSASKDVTSREMIAAKDAAVISGSTIAAASIRAPSGSKGLAKRRSTNLAVESRTRRVSNASSAHSSVDPVPPSPRVAQVERGHRSTKSISALPAPPQAASKQPNFIIPSFEMTFDRPPRSLLPRTQQSAASSATWRALGAVTNYVYGGDKNESPDETRGRKEGRDVGANLPRRIGLGDGNADDGWKNVKRVVVVGVHGWFPAKMLTSVIGEPTGTSVKFATMMGDAVKKFFNEKGVDSSEIRLTLIPLEGEGTIEDRVDKLYKSYLSNPAWINDLRRADAIFFAAHSQGCIVTTHLISRMIAQGHIRTALNRDAVARCEWGFGPIAIMPSEDSKKGRRLAAQLSGAEGGRQKVCMLAMCGVHLGPHFSISTSNVIQPYLHWFENAAARELFEFQDSQSAVSQAYQRALAMVLENEVRLVLLSSLNDQVVPIYGASFSTAVHPLLLRALYVDGASYSASDFMTNLLCFAFMLRNSGIDDQRLVEHLSEATAGSLTGVGHSTPYEELGCYSLAVQYLFHAGPASHPLPPLTVEPFAAREARNDFELPWIMRAIVDAPEVKDLFPAELQDLKQSILAWRPQTKALKEIKRRLEPMAGRQRRHPLATSANASDVG